ncbi:MAG: hypothetical protein AMS17_16715 [Spirochaetes bacterium DG_61]|jgi:hypothetical protein|nr:MAG: hypothetical protein AMS17_16715 [Spirochaetes bacterium DG_61]
MKISFTKGKEMYLTRLETRMDPEAMTDDIRFMLDPQPKKFWVIIEKTGGYFPKWTGAAQSGETYTVQKLLQAGADVNVQEKDGIFVCTFNGQCWRVIIYHARRLMSNSG